MQTQAWRGGCAGKGISWVLWWPVMGGICLFLDRSRRVFIGLVAIPPSITSCLGCHGCLWDYVPCHTDSSEVGRYDCKLDVCQT